MNLIRKCSENFSGICCTLIRCILTKYMQYNKKIIRLLAIVILFFCKQTLFGQEFSRIIKTEFDTLRFNRNAVLNDSKLLQLNNTLLLDSLSYLHTDSFANVRYNLMVLEYKIALRNPKDSIIVSKVMLNLLNSILDNEPYISNNALSILNNFNYQVFNKRFKEVFNQNFEKYPQTKNLYVLIGKLKWSEYKKYMLEKVNFNTIVSLSEFNMANWGMHLALAMMDNKESLTFCLNTIKTWPGIKDKYSYLFNDLKYLRNKNTIDLLKIELENTFTMPTIHNFQKKGRNCSFYAMDILTEMLLNFPVEKKKWVYSDSEMQQAREWLNKTTDYKFR